MKTKAIPAMIMAMLMFAIVAPINASAQPVQEDTQANVQAGNANPPDTGVPRGPGQGRSMRGMMRGMGQGPCMGGMMGGMGQGRGMGPMMGRQGQGPGMGRMMRGQGQGRGMGPMIGGQRCMCGCQCWQ